MLHCGCNVRIGKGCLLTPDHISIGNNVVIGDNSNIMATISYIYIGNDVVFGPRITIRGGNHRIDILGKQIIDVKESEKLPENDADVHIEDGVWIGENVMILKGVTVGEGSVIGAGSIVTKNVPPFTIHVGVHAPYEKPRFAQEEIKLHKQLLEDNKSLTKEH